jgi:hypothetical protein
LEGRELAGSRLQITDFNHKEDKEQKRLAKVAASHGKSAKNPLPPPFTLAGTWAFGPMSSLIALLPEEMIQLLCAVPG